MYNFVDLMNFEQRPYISAESLNFDGKWLEEEIDGFKITGVKGREILKGKIADNTHPVKDGSRFIRRTYEPREIEVFYRLESRSPEEFRDKYNKLNRLLYKEQSVFYFYDEPDKYYVGTVSDADSVDTGRNNIVSSFTIYCTDPFKYSRTNKEFLGTPVDGAKEVEVLIENGGNLPCPIDFEIYGNSDYKSLALVNETGVLQFGRGTAVEPETTYKERVEFQFRDADFSGMSNNVGGVIEGLGQTGKMETGSFTWDFNRWKPNAVISSGNPVNKTFYSNASRGFRLRVDITVSAVTATKATVQAEVNIEKITNTWAYNLVNGDNFKLQIGSTVAFEGKKTWDLRQGRTRAKVIDWSGDVPITSGAGKLTATVSFSPAGAYNAYYPQTLTGTENIVVATSIQNDKDNTHKCLYLKDTGTNNDGWHGSSMMKSATGISKSFFLSANVYASAGVDEMGIMYLAALTNDKVPLAMIVICKGSTTKSYGDIKLYVQGHGCIKTISADLTKHIGWEELRIEKTSEKFVFIVRGQRYTYYFRELKEITMKHAFIYLGQYGSNKMAPFFFNTMELFVFDQTVFVRGPARFKSGKKVFVDGANGKFYYDGVYAPSNEMIGSKYLTAPPGSSAVRVIVDESCTTVPTVIAKMKEKWV